MSALIRRLARPIKSRPLRTGEYDMSTERNKATVRRWNESLSNQDLDAFDEVLHPDYANRSSRKSPWAEGLLGIEATKAYFADLFEMHPTWKIAMDDLIAEGDKVAARMTWFEDGKPFGVAIACYRLVDGKIIDDWYTWAQLES
jgi:ketosteroid isomerase-like protein